MVANNLRELIIVHELSWYILVAHNDYFKTKNICDTQDYGISDITMLLNKMVLDKKLYKAGKKAMDNFFLNFEKYSLPFDYHIKNIQEELSNVFSIALKNLQEILDDAEPTNKVIFLQSRIKEIKQRELEYKQYEKEFNFDQRENRYSDLFKEFLIIEADFIKETIHIPRLPNIGYQQPKQLLDTKETLETIVNENDQLFIFKMMEDLSITLNGKSKLGERKKGAIRGVVEALKENKIFPDKSLDSLSRILAEKIGLKINSKLDFSETSQKYKKEANNYISNNYSN